MLGPERLGAVHFVDYTVGLIYSLASLGVPAYGLYRISQLHALGINKRKFYYQLMALHTTLSIIGFGLFYLAARNQSQWNYIEIILPIGVLQIAANSASTEWYLHGRSRFDFPTIRNFILRLIGLFAIFYLITDPSDYITYYWIITISLVLSAVINGIWIRRDLQTDVSDTAAPNIQWKELLLFYVGTVFISCTDYLDVTLLGILSSEEQVGYYGNTSKLIRLSLVLPLALNMVMSPRFASQFALDKKEEAKDTLNHSIEWIMYLSIPICFLYFLYADTIVIIFAGDAFKESAALMRWMAGIPLFISISNLLINYGLSGKQHGKRGKLATIVVLGLLVSLALNLWLIPRLGARGAAINSLIIELGFMIAFLVMIKPRLKVNRLTQTILSCLSFIPIWWLISNYEWNFIMELMVGGCCSVISYILMQLYVWENPFLVQAMNRALKIGGRS